MGSSGLISKEEGDSSEVESISLSEMFEDCCPIYMGYGMSYDEFWYGDPWAAKFYREAYAIQIKREDEGRWMQGVYIYEALCDVSPILHAFSKPHTKPLPFRESPYLHDVKINNNASRKQKEQEEKQRKENERLIAQIHFDRWMRETAKQFDKNKK